MAPAAEAEAAVVAFSLHVARNVGATLGYLSTEIPLLLRPRTSPPTAEAQMQMPSSKCDPRAIIAGATTFAALVFHPTITTTMVKAKSRGHGFQEGGCRTSEIQEPWMPHELMNMQKPTKTNAVLAKLQACTEPKKRPTDVCNSCPVVVT